MLQFFIDKLKQQTPLSAIEIEDFIQETSNGNSTKKELFEILELLSERKINAQEFFYFVYSMRKQTIYFDTEEIDVIDSCGTGADCASTFNISTTSALIACSLGAKVVKQTNSNITSRSGSSNFLEALNIPFYDNVEDAKAQFQRHSICFVHSPSFNKFIQVINPIRKEFGKRTLFNFTGPLINPSFPKYQLIGVSDFYMAEIMSQTARELGLKRAYIVHSKDPLLDELSICGKSDIFEIENGKIDHIEFHPNDMGLEIAPLKELQGATPQYNAGLVEDIFNNKIRGAKLDVLALNTGIMLLCYGLVSNLKDGIMETYKAIMNKKALEKLNELKN